MTRRTNAHPQRTHRQKQGVRKRRKHLNLLRAQVCVLGVQTERTHRRGVILIPPCAFCRAFDKESLRVALYQQPQFFFRHSDELKSGRQVDSTKAQSHRATKKYTEIPNG